MSSNTNSSMSSEAVSSSSNLPEVGSETFKTTALVPAQDAVNRALTTQISIRFDSAILAESYNDQAITISHGNNQLAGTLQQTSDDTLTFSPQALLPANAEITVKLSANIMSQEGLTHNGLSWVFNTTDDLGETSQKTLDSCMNARDISMLGHVNRTRKESRICGGTRRPATTSIRWNCLVKEAAQIHSNDMANNNFHDHTGSDGSSAGQRITRVGYNWRSWGENIAAGQPTVAAVMDSWIKSPGHCNNLMTPSHQEFGSGYAENNNSQYRVYWTQNFTIAQ